MDRITIVTSCERPRGDERISKGYDDKAVRLARSIRLNGGKYKDAKIVTWHAVGTSPSDKNRSRLERLGCEIIEGQNFIEQAPVSNKILAVGIDTDSEYILWMDSDMYVLDPIMFSKMIDLNVKSAATSSPYSYHRWTDLSGWSEQWKQFYAFAEMEDPKLTFLSGIDKKECRVSYNSALVLMKNDGVLPHLWKIFAEKIYYSGIPESQHNFTQTSLTVAMVVYGKEHKRLPESYNSYYSIRGEDSLKSAIVHYQDNIITSEKVKWDISDI